MVDGGAVGNKFYIINSELLNYSINVYNAADMKLMSTNNFMGRSCGNNENCLGNDFNYIKTVFLKDAIFVLVTSYNKTTEERQLYAQRLKSDGKFDGKMVLIDKISAERKRNSGSFLIETSEDSTKFLIVSNPPYERKQDEKFNFKIYDTKLTNLKNFGATLPYRDKDVSISDYYLGNDGSVHLLTRVILEKQDRQKGQAPYYFSILSLLKDSKELAEYKINLPSKNIEDITIRLDNKKNKIICTGFYGDLKPREYVGKDIDGFFYLRVDVASKAIESKSFKQIDKKMVAALVNKRKVKDNQGFSKSFEIVDLINREDGSSTLLAEYQNDYVITTTYTTGNGGMTTTTTYHYIRNNIFVINIAKDGTVESLIDIPKRQHTTNDSGLFSSYLLFEKGERIFVLYNDNPENLYNNARTIDEVEPIKKIKKTCLVAAEINKDGSYTKQKIYDYANDGLAITPGWAIKIKDGEYIAPAVHLPGISFSCIAIFTKIKKGLIKISL